MFTKFSGLVELKMAKLTFVLRLLKGRCYDNQFWREAAKIGLLRRHSSHLNSKSKTDLRITTPMQKD